MRTTIRIDEQLYRRVEARAGASGRTVSEVIEDAVRDALRPGSRDRKAAELPVFGGSGVLPGVDLADNAAVLEVMDEGAPLGALRRPLPDGGRQGQPGAGRLPGSTRHRTGSDLDLG